MRLHDITSGNRMTSSVPGLKNYEPVHHRHRQHNLKPFVSPLDARSGISATRWYTSAWLASPTFASFFTAAGRTIAAWGVHGALDGAAERFAARDAELWHLGLTKAGHSRHPLYVSYAVLPQRWTGRYAPGTMANR